MVHLLSWSPPKWSAKTFWRVDTRPGNFGDELSRVIVGRILDTRLTMANALTEGPRRLLALGSILQLAKDGDTIWGSGFISEHSRMNKSQKRMLDVRAVRGPLTRRKLQEFGLETPEVYGDPGILMRHLGLLPTTEEKKVRLSILPHLSDSTSSLRDPFFDDLAVISPRQAWESVLRAISESEYLVTSSLHGKIVADQLGVPCALYKSRTQSFFKYQDYFEGAQLDVEEIYDSPERASSKVVTRSAAKFDAQVAERLLQAFPIDIF